MCKKSLFILVEYPSLIHIGKIWSIVIVMLTIASLIIAPMHRSLYNSHNKCNSTDFSANTSTQDNIKNLIKLSFTAPEATLNCLCKPIWMLSQIMQLLTERCATYLFSNRFNFFRLFSLAAQNNPKISSKFTFTTQNMSRRRKKERETGCRKAEVSCGQGRRDCCLPLCDKTQT